MVAKKRAMIFIHLFYLSGMMIFTLGSIFRHSLTDFQLGFCEGFAIVAMITGLIYIIWNLAYHKNPFKF